MTQPKLAIRVEDLTVAYASKPVLWDVDLQVPERELMALVGPNGAGKTTLIKAMLGLIQPVSGYVEFPGGKTHPNGGSRIGYVPQSGSVEWDFPATVFDIVLMGTYAQLGWIRRPGATQKRLAQQMLDKVGMADYAKRQISQLSGGQQQRVFLARALAQTADIYLMDEPFKGVDARTELAIVQLLQDLQQAGKTVLVVHHDLQTVTEYFDAVTLINRRVIASGAVEEVFHSKNIDRTYRAELAV